MANIDKKTHWKKLTNPNYLGAYSLEPGKDMILTIEKVVREQVEGEGGKKEECTVAYFKEPQKPMILNKTNCKTITKVHGTPYIEDWSGKQIQLYAANVKAFGETVEALRIRNIIPKQQQKPELNPQHPKWEGAIKSLQSGNTTIEDIKRVYSLTAQNEKTLCESLKSEEAAAAR